MPKVGSVHFSYDKEGMAAAKAEAKRTGKKMTNAKPKRKKKSTGKY